MTNEDKKRSMIMTNCVCDVVNFINELQDCAAGSACPTGCDVPFLGSNPGMALANTRPFVLKQKGCCDGNFTANFFVPTGTSTFACGTSEIFRVESVDDCCAVLRVLALRSSTGGGAGTIDESTTFCDVFGPPERILIATSSCITVDLECFCAIQCLPDVNITGV